jgi:hypothetical protein
MLLPTTVRCGGRYGWLRRMTLIGLSAAGVTALTIAGCPKPTYDEMFPGVTLKQITDIRNSTTLTTDAQKLQALKDLGITDPQVLEILLHAPLPATSTTG